VLEDLGKVVETAVVLLRRGWLAAIGAAAPFVALAVLLAATADGGAAALGAFTLMGAFGAVLAAFTLALEGRPRARDALVCVLTPETLHLFWALPAFGVFGSIAAACAVSALRDDLPIIGWLLMGTPLVGMFVTMAALLGGVLLVTVATYATRGGDLPPRLDDLVAPNHVLVPLGAVLPSVVVVAAVAGGWWNPRVTTWAPGLLEVATGVGVFVAVVLLALVPPALYGVLRSRRATA